MNDARATQFVAKVQKEFIDKIEDPRKGDVDHPLLNILVFALGSFLTGGVGWEDMEQFARLRAKLFAAALDLTHGTPSADTFRRLFEDIDLRPFMDALGHWLRSLAKSLHGEVLAGDGKSLGGTSPASSPTVPLHLLHLFATSQRLLFGLREVKGAPGEIQGLLDLIPTLSIEGAILTTDANECTRKVTVAILKAQAEFMLALKENRRHLFKWVAKLFAEAEKNGWAGVETHTEADKGHGRLELRTVRVLPLPKWDCPGKPWEGVKAVVQITRQREVKGKVTVEVHYYVTSLLVKAERAGEIIRQHWQVENRLHHVLDVTMNEDRRRNRGERSALNVAALCRLALALLEKAPPKLSIRKRQREAAADDTYLLRLLTSDFP